MIWRSGPDVPFAMSKFQTCLFGNLQGLTEPSLPSAERPPRPMLLESNDQDRVVGRILFDARDLGGDIS